VVKEKDYNKTATFAPPIFHDTLEEKSRMENNTMFLHKCERLIMGIYIDLNDKYV